MVRRIMVLVLVAVVVCGDERAEGVEMAGVVAIADRASLGVLSLFLGVGGRGGLVTVLKSPRRKKKEVGWGGRDRNS